LIRELEPGTETLTLRLALGDWTIRAKAYLDGNVLGEGETAITVEADRTNYAVLNMTETAWYVAQGGNDATGDGSEAAPYATMDRALEAIKAAYAGERWPGKGASGAAKAEIRISGIITTGTGDADSMAVIGDTDLYALYPPVILAGKTSTNDENRLDAGGSRRVLFVEKADVTLAEGLTLTGGRAADGGGVYIKGGSFTMSGGTISGNTARDDGGGVYLDDGTFALSGGTINGNHAESDFYGDGGGVFVNYGTFTMTDGTISGNTASGATVTNGGGGVFVESGTFQMSGGAINGNQADGATGVGGGVRVHGTFAMTGGSISANRTTSGSFGSGGGVYVANNGTFSKTGGSIYGRDAAESLRNVAASGNGHAVFVNGVVILFNKERNSTAGPADNLDSAKSGSEGGWE
jgi:hypothetical protein